MRHVTKYLMLIALLSCCSCIKTLKCNYDREYILVNETGKDLAFVYAVSDMGYAPDGSISKPYFSFRDIVTAGPYKSDDINVGISDALYVKLSVLIPPYDLDGVSFKCMVHQHLYNSSCSSYDFTSGYCSYYNLTDTTSIVLSEMPNADTLFNRLASKKQVLRNDNGFYCSIINIRITDSALALMEKDTTMLRLFPGYYGTAAGAE